MSSFQALPNDEENVNSATEQNVNTRNAKWGERRRLQGELNDEFLQAAAANDDCASIVGLVKDPRIAQLNRLVEEMKQWDIEKTIPEPKSFLRHTKLQNVLVALLKNMHKNTTCLMIFIESFSAHNECIHPDLRVPLHYAVRELHEDFTMWLLDRPGIDVNIRNLERCTPLMELCQMYSKAVKLNRSATGAESLPDVDAIRRFIKLLLERGADFNICSLSLKLPFDSLLEGAEQDNFAADCADMVSGIIVVSKKQKQKQPTVEFYKSGSSELTITAEVLEVFLRYQDLAQFEKYLKSNAFEVDDGNVKKIITLLLHTAVDNNLNECVMQLIKKAGVQMFQTEPNTSTLLHRLELKGLLKKVCHRGNVRLLNEFMQKMSDRVLINGNPLLVVTLNKAYELRNRTPERDNLLKCAELLAKDHSVHITKADNHGNTPLHLALQYGFEGIAQILLKQRHAYIAWPNKNLITPVDYAGYQFWKSFFDRCIEVDTKRSAPDRNVLRFNLNCFEELKTNKLMPENAGGSLCGWKVCPKVRGQSTTNVVTEMTPVLKIAKSPDLKRLLLHPLVYTFIKIKWMQVNHWNCLNLFATMLVAIFCASNSYVHCTVGERNWWLVSLTGLGAFYLLFREAVQFMFLGRHYISFENMLDLITIVCIVIVLSGCKQYWSSFVIILFAVHLTSLLSSLPSHNLSTIMYMFKTVLKNFTWSFLLFVPLVFAFIYSFFLCNKITPSTDPSPANASQNEFNEFASMRTAILKTLVMATGEFEAAAMDFNDSRYYLFVAFLFFIPIVLMNLINGLAVSDITAIREESELISLIKKVNLLARYERGYMMRRQPSFIRSWFPKPFFDSHPCWIFVNTKENGTVYVEAKQDARKKGSKISVPTPTSVDVDLNDFSIKKAKPKHSSKTDDKQRKKETISCLPNRFVVDFVNKCLHKKIGILQLDEQIMEEAVRLVENKTELETTGKGTTGSLLRDAALKKELIELIKELVQQNVHSVGNQSAGIV